MLAIHFFRTKVKGIVHQKLKLFHHLLTLMFFQNCLTNFVLWNKDILRNVSFVFLYNESQRSPKYLVTYIL